MKEHGIGLKWFYPFANIKHDVHVVLTIRCTSINYDHLHVHLDNLAPIINASSVIGEVKCRE